jgi:formyl-CoA transferase
MTKPLEGIKILDFTHVQAGPVCTQLLAWFGADVIKVERPETGDITRSQLRDIPNVDSLYFTMMNGNKRSITLDTKNPHGRQVLEELIKICDVLVENFAPGVLDRMGFTWEKVHAINPKIIVASVKGFGPGPFEDCKAYENVAQCTGGAASTTVFATEYHWLPARGSEIRERAFTLRWASSRRSINAPIPGRGSGYWRRCRTRFSISAE